VVVSAVFDRKNRCRGPLRVGSTCNVGKKLATHVADMSATCRRHIWLSHYTGLLRSTRKVFNKNSKQHPLVFHQGTVEVRGKISYHTCERSNQLSINDLSQMWIGWNEGRWGMAKEQ